MNVDDNRLPHIRCITCGKVTGNLLYKYDRLIGEGYEKRRIIENLLQELPVPEVLNELVRQGMVPINVIENFQERNLTPEEMLNRIIRRFSPEGSLDALGLTRYCCRRTVLNPIILPMGSSLELGESIRTLEKQEAYRINNPLRSMTQPQAINTVQQGPLQPISRIAPPTNQVRRTNTSSQPITRTLNLQTGQQATRTTTPQQTLRPTRPALRPIGSQQAPTRVTFGS